MKRYEMTTEYNKLACADQVIPVETPDGEWVRFKDIPNDLEALRKELNRITWIGSDEGWDFAIAAVLNHIEIKLEEKKNANA